MVWVEPSSKQLLQFTGYVLQIDFKCHSIENKRCSYITFDGKSGVATQRESNSLKYEENNPKHFIS